MGALEEGQIANLVATLDSLAVTPDAFVTGVAQALAAYVAARKDALTAGTLRMGEAPVVVGGVRVTITLDDGANHIDGSLAVDTEREACAQACDEYARSQSIGHGDFTRTIVKAEERAPREMAARICAAKIRARGRTP